MSCPRIIEDIKPQRHKGRQGKWYFPNRSGRFGKDSNPPGNQRILPGRSSSSIGGASFSDLSGRPVRRSFGEDVSTQSEA